MTRSNSSAVAGPSSDDYGYATHDVLNQPPALADYDVYGSDPVLQSVVRTFDAEWAEQKLRDAGQVIGSAHVQELARQANRQLPELRTHDRFGNRVDRIEFHPAWHELMTLAMGHETHALCWNDPRTGAQVARGALSYMWNQGENGICCPISMTYSAIPILRRDPARWAEWGKLLSSSRYDGRQMRATEKTGATVGMAMTEKQGGSDLAPNPDSRASQSATAHASIVGHKWFFSVPHSRRVSYARAHRRRRVVLSWCPAGCRTDRATACKFSGSRTSAATSPMPRREVEFRGALAHLLGEEGHGIRTMIEMAH